jgi:beta-lactamase class A
MADEFAAEVATLAEDTDLEAAAVAINIVDGSAATGHWHVNGDRWFHAASTIKVAILVALAQAIGEGRFELISRLAVRNRFLSAVDGAPFRIAAGRDANGAVHAHIGRTLRLEELAFHMITTSSNLATNLLLDLVGVDYARAHLDRLGIAGIDLRRGVEDERAFAADINNRVTANGLVQLFTAIQDGRAAAASATEWMVEVLAQQEFTSGLPAGLPDEVRATARVAHKTGEISNMAHDAGLVFLPDGIVYAIALLTETKPGGTPRQQTVAKLSRAAYSRVVAVTGGERTS